MAGGGREQGRRQRFVRAFGDERRVRRTGAAYQGWSQPAPPLPTRRPACLCSLPILSLSLSLPPQALEAAKAGGGGGGSFGLPTDEDVYCFYITVGQRVWVDGAGKPWPGKVVGVGEGPAGS
eukprot:SAG22_NODE_5475_length_1007_cov_1.426211_1_plen_121_part_01